MISFMPQQTYIVIAYHKNYAVLILDEQTSFFKNVKVLFSLSEDCLSYKAEPIVLLMVIFFVSILQTTGQAQ